MPIGASLLGRKAGPDIGALPPSPSYIRYIPQGEVTNGWPHAEDPFIGRRVRRSAQQRAGKAYEKRVAQFLYRSAWAGAVLHSPWFAYTDAGASVRFCQPDFILDKGRGQEAIVVECKLRWHPDAWWQLTRIYLPVLRWALPGRELIPLCICGSYDPSIPAPGPVQVVRSIPRSGGVHASQRPLPVMVVR